MQRERIVSRSISGREVRRRTRLEAGGSSRVLRKALLAESPMQSASRITANFVTPEGAAMCRVCSTSRIASTEILRDFDSGATMLTKPERSSSSFSGGMSRSPGFAISIMRMASRSFPLPGGPMIR